MEDSLLKMLHVRRECAVRKTALENLRQRIRDASNEVCARSRINEKKKKRRRRGRESVCQPTSAHRAGPQDKANDEWDVLSDLDKLRPPARDDAHGKKTREFANFRKRVWEVAHNEPFPGVDGEKRAGGGGGGGGDDDDDDELVINKSKANVVCPLSRALFDDPVRAQCGHTFSRQALLDLARQTKGASKQPPCPIPGCTRKINMAKLEADEDKAYEVREYKRREASKRKRGRVL